MYMYMYVYIYIYMCIHIYIYIYIYRERERERESRGRSAASASAPGPATSPPRGRRPEQRRKGLFIVATRTPRLKIGARQTQLLFCNGQQKHHTALS